METAELRARSTGRLPISFHNGIIAVFLTVGKTICEKIYGGGHWKNAWTGPQ